MARNVMSGISLAKTLETKSFKQSSILTGKDALDRLVTSVTVGEVPDIANWLTGGELVLSTFFAVSSDPAALASFARKIITGPAAALAIKPTRFLKSLPEAIIKLGEAHNFPIIEVPEDVRWTSVIADFYDAITEEDITAAVELARSKALEEAEIRMFKDFLNDLIAGRIPLEQLDSRVANLGADFSGGFAVLYCKLTKAADLRHFHREALRYVKAESKGSLLIEHDGGLVIILAQSGESAKTSPASHARQVAKRLLAIAEALDSRVTIGVSRIRSNEEDIIKCLDEAKVALDSGRRLAGAGSITDFDEVGIYRLLLPLTRDSQEDGRLYYNETIGRLDKYDRQHSTNLVETLESFRLNDENIAMTAEELFTHRHTVRYRLQRIAEITGSDPFKSTEREKLYMGLHIKHLLSL